MFLVFSYTLIPPSCDIQLGVIVMKIVISWEARMEHDMPDEWLLEAGIQAFIPTAESYKPQGERFAIVPLSSIRPLKRAKGFEEPRMIRILKAFKNYDCIPPVEVVRISESTYSYSLYDGYHRYWASIAVGFTKIPVTLWEI